MIPQDHKIDFSKCKNKSKGYKTKDATFKKYGKEWCIKEYIQESKDGTSAKDIINKAGGLQNLPRINENIKETGISIDMNEDIFTINHKIKLGNIAKRNIEKLNQMKEAMNKKEGVVTKENGGEE